MNSPSYRTTLLIGLVGYAALASTAAFSSEVIKAADRCSAYGAGMVEFGNGVCGQGASTRIGDAPHGAWGPGASNAGLRSDGMGMLPGVGNVRHLRVQSSPSYR